MSFEQAPVAQLEALFRRIHEDQMAGMPVLNPALAVEAVGFQLTAYGWLGILITPWFMNLMLLPAVGRPWTTLAVGKQCNLTFPSGEYLFSADQDDELGEYFSCQLFSPMYHFPDRETARTAAQAAIQAVVGKAPPPPALEPPTAEISHSKRRLLRGWSQS